MPRDRTSVASTSVSEQRQEYEQMLTSFPVPADVNIVDGELGGVAVVEIDIRTSAGDERSSDVLLFLHGGGYVLGSGRAYARFAAEVARVSDTRVISVDYRRAPEDPHPAALEDALAVYQALLESGLAPKRIAVVGDSAGGGLALATLIAAKRHGLPMPASAAVFSPWTDLALSGESLRTKADVDLTFGDSVDTLLANLARAYTSTQDATDPLISPVYADLSGLPPLLIQVGSHEVLLDDATRLASRAAAADVPVTLDVTAKAGHIFQLSPCLRETREALTRTGHFLRRQFGG
ncbi:alpha/beta hydrolase [Streptomyces rapamycinicus]|uniref:Alpha/beta hydrolase n=2 Tax=Streptomyces rhizosphaericus TaxID=114699 RepID=A0A6G4AAP3_9ACTN|nr:alpha/beta hydrolase [Streptomyces rhizosphaericus]